MGRNIEIKARVEKISSLIPLVSSIADKGPVELVQDDAFFNCPNGRLKLRVFSDGEGELIFYRRGNEQGPKESFYIHSRTSTPEALREVLSSAYGESGRILKRRLLFLAGRTRIHLDQVEGLGDFVELEVVLIGGEDMKEGVAEAQNMMLRLGISDSQLIDGAYIDLLQDAV